MTGQRIETAAGLRRVNQETILKTLRHDGPQTITMLADRMKVPVATISRVTGSLLDRSLVVSSKGEPKRSIGRPPTVIDINADFASIIGIELGPREIRMLAADFKGYPLRSAILPTNSLQPRIETALCQTILKFRNEFFGIHGSSAPLQGISIGVSGIVSPETGKVFQGFLPHGLEITPLVEDALETPVLTDNDANLATLAEHRFGTSAGCSHLTCLLDRGWPGAGMIINGNLYRGANNMAGELSSTVFQATPDHPAWPRPLPITESFGLERRILELGYRRLDVDRFSSRSDMIAELTTLAMENDPLALELLKKEASAMAATLATLSRLLDPQRIVLAGDFTESGALGVDCLQATFRILMNDTPAFAEIAPRVGFSRLGQDVVTIGGIAAMMERITHQAIHQPLEELVDASS